jgi:nucleoside-diphosphate-sugar epimerase
MGKDVILVTGANGQIGGVLTKALREAFGTNYVIATDIRKPEFNNEPFEILDILNKERLFQLVERYKVTQVYHLAAILSAKGELNPQFAWRVNMEGLFNVLEVGRFEQIQKIFFPSSIAVFGQQTPRENTPQNTVLHPSSVYGISKAAGENWGQYYFQKFGVDIRSLRFPGIISHENPPGGGTTDYAVDIYYSAVKGEDYTCFLRADTRLPMMYLPDAVRGTLELMEAPADKINIRTAYNLGAMSFTPAEIYKAILIHEPGFKINYEPDFRQLIADSWSASVDDSAAKQDWGWQPKFDLQKMTKDMLYHLRKKQTTPEENLF